MNTKILVVALAISLTMIPIVSAMADGAKNGEPAWLAELNTKPVSDERASKIRGECFGPALYFCLVAGGFVLNYMLTGVNYSAVLGIRSEIKKIMMRVGRTRWNQFRMRNHGLPAYSRHYG